MGKYLETTESRSELQQRIAAELKAKAAARAKQEAGDNDTYYKERDGIEDSAYVQGLKSTTTLSPVWIMIVVMTVAVFGLFIYQANH